MSSTSAKPRDLDREVGEVAIRLHTLTPQQVEQALAARAAPTADGREPGAIFVEQGLLTRSQLDYLETVRRFKNERIADAKFGDLAIARGWATPEQVNAAMEVQRILFVKEHKQVLIGEMLVRQKAITGEQRDIILTLQHRARAEQQRPKPAAAGLPPAGPVASAAAPTAAIDEPPPEPAAATPPPAAPAEPETMVTASALTAPEAAAPAVAAVSEPKAVPPSPAPEPATTKARGGKTAAGFKVTISADRLAAHLTVEGDAPATDTAALQQLLTDYGVTFGVDEAALQRIAAGNLAAGETIRVAEGQPPTPGRDAAIEYLFELHPLSAGREAEDATIDFRDRGDLPEVAVGTVLARRQPPEEGAPGYDVGGRPIQPRKPRNRPLRAGNGVALDTDGLTATAQSAGRPALSPSGVISVFPEHRIDGDVDFSTGHVTFSGRVVVTGRVNPGFRVRCGALVAGEVDGAEVVADGDITVSGGVIGSRIEAGGAVAAKYFHTSRVQATGDVAARAEGFESVIETSGAFIGPRCTLLATQVSARQGITALEVGSPSSPPCRLAVGVDDSVEHRIEGLEAEIAKLEAATATLVGEQSELTATKEKVEGQIAALAQVEDQARVRLRESEPAAEAGDGHAKDLVALLQEQIASTDRELAELFERQDAATAALDQHVVQQAAGEAAIMGHRAEIAELREWSEEEPPKAELKVQQKAYQGTVIRGPHTELQLKEDKSRLWLVEREVTDADGNTEWKFDYQ